MQVGFKVNKDTNKRSMIHVDDLVRALVFTVNESSGLSH